MTAPLPADEPGRLAALRATGLMHSLPEQEFDELVRLAAHLCQTPMAAISLVGAEQQWFKAQLGLPTFETSREDAFCAHAILDPGQPLVVRDAHADSRFARSALVTTPPHIRFYAGAPVIGPGGHVLGSLCVMDRQPRELTPEQLAGLVFLSRQVTQLQESRRLAVELAEYEAAVDLHALLAIVQCDGRLIQANERFCAVTGIDRRMLVLPATDVRSQQHLAHGFFAPCWEALLRGEVVRREVTGLTPAGGRYWINTTVAPLRNPSGQPAQFIAIGTDITAQKAVQGELDAARTRAEAAVAARSRFLAELSQQLHPPLGTITEIAATLLRQPLSDAVRTPVALMHECGEALARNVQTLLAHPTLESGKLPLAAAPVSPAEIARADRARPAPAPGAVALQDLSRPAEPAPAPAFLPTVNAPSVPAPGKLGDRIPLRILSADDVPTNRDMLRFMCRHLGYTTDLVTNGLEVLEKLRTQSYDLLLLDVNMPEMDGLTATREILRLYPAPSSRPKIVAVTANALIGDRERCLGAGMDDYLTKPLVPKNLIACIERHFADDVVLKAGSSPAKPVREVPLLDTEYLQNLTAGLDPSVSAALISQLHDAVKRDCFTLWPRVATACAARDGDDLHNVLHGLKGCVLTAGWGRLAAACGEAMTQLREKQFARWATLPAELEAIHDTSVLALDALLAVSARSTASVPAPVA